MSFKKNYSKLSNWFLTNPPITSFLAFLLMLSIVGSVISLRYKIIKENENKEMATILTLINQNLNQVLNSSYITTITLAMTINDDSIPENFDVIAKKLVSANNYIDAVNLSPNGVVKYIYPVKGNEALLNFDVLNAPMFRKEALESIKTKQIYFLLDH
jgi:sensor domain CHASE-containing protein